MEITKTRAARTADPRTGRRRRALIHSLHTASCARNASTRTRSHGSGMTKTTIAAALASLLAGCMMTEATMSSRTYLAPEQSGGVTAHNVIDTAREVTRLFEVRGFQLMDQHPNAPNGELVLEYAKSNRALAATKDGSQVIGSSDVGSVFFVWVTPTDSGARVAMIGKPTLAGVQPCTKDDVQLPCQTVSANPTFVSTYMSGKDEADVVHGVLAELSLEGYVTGPVPAGTPPPVYTIAPSVLRKEAHDRCVAQRKQAMANAEGVPDLDKRAELLAEIKGCP